MNCSFWLRIGIGRFTRQRIYLNHYYVDKRVLPIYTQSEKWKTCMFLRYAPRRRIDKCDSALKAILWDKRVHFSVYGDKGTSNHSKTGKSADGESSKAYKHKEEIGAFHNRSSHLV